MVIVISAVFTELSSKKWNRTTVDVDTNISGELEASVCSQQWQAQ
jgi:hypothetical protein